MKSFKRLLTILLLMPFAAFAASDKTVATNAMPDIALYLIGGFGIVIIFAASSTIFNLLFTVLDEKEKEILEGQGLSSDATQATTKAPSLWQKWRKKLTDAVPLEKEQDILLDHNYDGIRELDNNLPPWWLYGFYLSIVVSVFYIGYYHYSDYAISSTEKYALEMKNAEEEIRRYIAAQGGNIDETNVTLLTDEKALADGQTLFNVNCVTCHLATAAGGPGSVGPNLVDEFWLHGGGVKNVFKTIKYGVPEKGMISWKAQLRPSDMQKVASYILSLQGSNPPIAKEPQGEKWIPEEEAETEE